MKNENAWNGIFSRDKLPGKIKSKENGIVNLDLSTGEGNHWVAYFNSPDCQYAVYFDSYGLAPPPEIYEFLKTSGKKIIFNNNEMQKMNSIMCGYYCIHFIKEMNKKKPFHEIIYEFDTQPTDFNEKLIKNLFSSANI